MVIVVMGVAGAGKTTVGARLAAELGWPFHDADEFHPPENIEHMAAGAPLSDRHRKPWLQALARLIGRHVRTGRSMVLACSALSRAHRVVLLSDSGAGDVRLVHLHAGPELLAERLAQRAGHFFPPELLASQLAALQPPEEDDAVLVLDAGLTPDELVGEIRAALRV